MNRAPWLLLLLSLHACSAEEYVLKTVDGEFCIPKRLVVEINTRDIPNEQYDSQGGGYEISLLFKSEELVSAIDGYQEIALKPGIPGHQSTYIMLSEAADSQTINDIPSSAEPLESVPQLIRLEQDDIAWQVAEKSQGEYLHWGNCSSSFDTENTFDCIRDFEIGNLRMSYQIHKRNLGLYPAIDAFLAGQADKWRCQSR